MKSFKDLEVYNEAMEIAVEVYQETLKMTNIDKFETSSQLRRSTQSIKDNIAEGYGRRRYKSDFIKFLVYSHASCLEAISQAEFFQRVLEDDKWGVLKMRLEALGGKIFKVMDQVE